MSKQWYLKFPGDYARKTAHLSTTEHGAYSLLIDHYYSTGKPLPADFKRLRQIARTRSQSESNAVKTVVNEFFQLEGDGYVHKRIEEELVRVRDISEKRSTAAKKRWETHNAIAYPNADADAMPPQPQPLCIKEKKINKKKDGPAKVSIQLPDWLPEATWEDFRIHRKRLKAPMTPRGEELTIAKLGRLKDQGYDAVKVLERSIEHGWKGIFELAEGTNASIPQGNGGHGPGGNGNNGHHVMPGESQWWRSDEGIKRMGQKTGTQARSGESYRDYAQRIAEKLRQEGPEFASKPH